MIQHQFMFFKKLRKIGKRKLFNLTRGIHGKPIANTPNGEELDVFIVRLGSLHGSLFSPLLFNTVREGGGPSHCNKARQINKSHKYWIEKIKMFICWRYDYLYRKS